MKKEDIIKLIDKKIESLISYKSKILDILLVNENDGFANEQYIITIHQIYILQDLKKDVIGDKNER